MTFHMATPRWKSECSSVWGKKLDILTEMLNLTLSAHSRVCLSLSVSVHAFTFLQPSAWSHSIVPLLVIGYGSFIWFVLPFLCGIKSNWCNKSNWAKAVGVVPHSCLAVSNEQTVVRHAPICQVCEGRVGTGTRVLKKSQRRTQSRALESCITGWADDEASRGCLSHHHTHCFLTPLLSPPVFSLSNPHPPKKKKKTCLYHLLLLYVLHLSPLFFLLVVFGSGSCKHSFLCLHIYIQHHLLGLWLDYLHFSRNERQRSPLLCQQSASCFHRHWLLSPSKANSACFPGFKGYRRRDCRNIWSNGSESKGK